MKYLYILIFFFFSAFLSAQFNVDDFQAMKFRSIGPAGMSGRITAIDVDLSNPDRIFAGAASGGVWLSENGGTSWKPIFDDQSSLAIGAIKINQKNPSEIWVGTGEGNPRNSLNTGNGIYKSIDGGKTWKNMGLGSTKTIHRIIIHQDNPLIVFVAALGSPWGPNPERGVFKTTDGGKTWKKILYVNDLTGAADMIVDPTNPNKIWVAMWEHKREPWFFNSGGEGSGLYMTNDSGENFTKLTDKEGLPKGNLGRIGLAIAASKPNIVYALVEAKENGLYKSIDGGSKWDLVSTKNIGDRPFYYSELYVDPLNENRIFNVYTYLSMSEDGGRTFKEIANYGNNVHPDHHALWIHPTNPNFIIDGNDGGLTISRDGGKNWHFSSNIPVGQFYHVNYDLDFPYNVYGGMQDNGSWVGPSSVLKRGGIRNYDFKELYFGDGFDVVPYPKDSRYGYAMSQGGNVGFYDRLTGRSRFIKPIHPDKSVTLRFNWNAAIAQNPFDSESIYFGSQYLHYSNDKGETWKIISPDLTTNDTTKQNAHKSGGLTLDATNAENYCTLLAIAPSSLDSNLLWVSSDDGQLHITLDKGNQWKSVHQRLTGLPSNSWIPQIHPSTYNKGEAWVVANNYRRNDYKPYAYHTADFGNSWQRIAFEDQIKGFVLSIVQDHKSPNLLFLGTDVGLYVSFDKGKNWHHWYKGLPQVQIADMKIHPTEDDLILGTFGRAFYILDDINPLRRIADESESILKKDFGLFPSTAGYKVSYSSVDGIRFIGQSEFVGENKAHDKVDINVWLHPNKWSEEDKAKASIQIYDEDGRLIRKFSSKMEKGLKKVTWRLEQDGIRFPSRNNPSNEDDAPGGVQVFPGKYKVVIAYKDYKDSTTVVVKADPRIIFDQNEVMQIQDATNKIYAMADVCKKQFDWILEAKKTIGLVEKLLELQPDSTKNAINERHKLINKKLDELGNLYLDAEGLKGIQSNPNTVNAKLFNGLRYLRSAWQSPQENALIAFEHGIKTANEANSRVESFKADDWKSYQDLINSLPLKVFKD